MGTEMALKPEESLSLGKTNRGIKGHKKYERNCNYCGRFYSSYQNDKFCSRACWLKGHRGSVHHLYKVKPFETCILCGKELPHKRHDGRKYCSKECLNKTRPGRTVDNKGYICLLDPRKLGKSYPYTPEHRIVMEQHLKRDLTANEVVHHINGIKTDNRIENLSIVTKNTHLGTVTCPHCHKQFQIR